MTSQRQNKPAQAEPAKTHKKHQNQAMQRYLRYLKSDNHSLTEDEGISQYVLDAWQSKPVSYPPYED